MVITTNKKAKDDNRIARIVLVAENDLEHELLEDILEYLNYREIELNNKEYADLRIQM